MSLPTNSTSVSSIFFQRSKAAAVRTTSTERSSTASSGSCAPVLPGGMYPSGMATGRPSTTGSDAGPKTARSNRLFVTSKANSTQRAASTGASSMWIAPSCRPPGPPLVVQTMIKRGPNQGRRRRRTGARLQPGWVLYEDPSAYRPARPPAGSRPIGRSASRVGLLRRSDGRGVGSSPQRTAAEAPRGSCGRSSLRCRLDPAVVHGQRDRVSNPDPQGHPRGPRSPTNLR